MKRPTWLIPSQLLHLKITVAVIFLSQTFFSVNMESTLAILGKPIDR